MIEYRKDSSKDSASRSSAEDRPEPGLPEPHPKAPNPSYEIRIRGRVEEWVISDFADMIATVEPVDTVLFGQVRDQSALHGLLDRIQARGLELIEVRRLPDSAPSSSDVAPPSQDAA